MQGPLSGVGDTRYSGSELIMRKLTGQPAAIIDCFGMLDGDIIRRYFD